MPKIFDSLTPALLRTLALAVALLALAAPSSLAAPPKHGQASVIGGSVSTATDAPWAVFIVWTAGTNDGKYSSCSGSIISATQIVTAGHCADLPVSGYRVYAGWRPGPEGRAFSTAFDQSRALSAVRSHPGFVEDEFGAPDDIALMTLASPLDLSGPRVGAVALAGAAPAPGTGLHLYGYGTPHVGEMRVYTVTLSPRWQCGPWNSVWSCGTSPDGQGCGGDSGGGLIAAETPPRLVGVANTGEYPCRIGGRNTYADTAAPEISRWLAGEAAPPVAPRQLEAPAPALTASAFPDGAVHCSPGAWSDSSTSTFSFQDSATGAVLQDGPSSAWLPTAQDAGRTVRCIASVGNAGGIGQTSPDATLTVPSARNLTVSRGVATTQYWNLGQLAALTFTDVRARELARIVLDQPTDLPAKFPKLPVGAYSVCLELAPEGGFTAWRECVPATVDAAATTLVRRVRARRHGSRYTVQLAVTGPAAGQRVRATWTSARCKTCVYHRISRPRVKLRSKLTLHSPAVARGRWLRLQLALPQMAVDGGRYTAGTAKLAIGRRPK